MIPPLAWRPADDIGFHPDRPGPWPLPPDTLFRAWPASMAGRRPHRPHPPVAEAWDPAPVPPEPREGAQAKPRLLLSHPRWAEAKGVIGAKATACVDAGAPPTPATRVVFRSWVEWGEGSRADLPDCEGHIPAAGGTVAVAIDLPAPASGRAPVAACRYFFSARHSLSDPVASGPLEAAPDPGPAFDGAILYAPARAEYLWLPGEAVRDVLEETGRLRSLRDRSLLAWENPDPSRRAMALRDLAEESAALFGGGGASRAKGGVEELLLVKGNPRWNGAADWIYLRSGAQVPSGSWRKGDDPAVRAELDKLAGPEGEKRLSPLLRSKFKVNLFRARPKAGDLWHWSHAAGTGNGEGTGATGADPERRPEPPSAGASAAPAAEPRRFAFTAEAALGRYFAGWDGHASLTPGARKVGLGCAGSASLALFEGKVALTVDLPGPRGLNILGWLAGVKHLGIYLIDPKRTCPVKLKLQGSLSAFVGGSAQGALSLTGSLAGHPRAEGGAEAAAFVGAQAKGDCRGDLQWAPSPAGPFADLAAVKSGLGASAGVGAEAKLKVEYAQGVFRFGISAGASLGLGLKGGAGFELGARNALRFLGHILDGVDFHFVKAISAEAFAAYRNYALAAILGESEREASAQARAREETDWARHGIGNFAAWLRERAARIAILKAEILARSGERSLLRKMPPEALGRALIALMRTREEADFQGIRYLLGSTVREEQGPAATVSPGHKLKWALRSVSDLPIPAPGEPGREAGKREALEAGIRIIREFGMAEGRWAGQRGLPGESGFTAWFHRFLELNGI